MRPTVIGTPSAVWDLDGTLTRYDTLLPFLRRIAGTRAVLSALAVPSTDRDAAKARVLQQILGGRTVAEVDQTARDYAARVVGNRLRADSLACWTAHRRAGHRLVLASASPGLYLHHIGRLLEADEVICTEMAVVNGRLTGAIRGGNCRGTEKARRVLAHLTEQPSGRVWAYADGAADRPLLALADVAVRVTRFGRLPCGAGR